MTLSNLYFRNAVMPFKWNRLLRISIEHFVADSEKEGIKDVYIQQKENNIFPLNILIIMQILF
jgi:hypothetical protein